jgi:hypothetical protein
LFEAEQIIAAQHAEGRAMPPVQAIALARQQALQLG